MKNRTVLVLFVVFLALAVVAFGLGRSSASAHTALRPTTPLPVGNKAPSKQFLEDYNEFIQLRDEIQAITRREHLQQKTDQLNGIVTRLNGQVPPGYMWDENSVSFAQLQIPVSAQPPAPTQPKQ